MIAVFLESDAFSPPIKTGELLRSESIESEPFGSTVNEPFGSIFKAALDKKSLQICLLGIKKAGNRLGPLGFIQHWVSLYHRNLEGFKGHGKDIAGFGRPTSLTKCVLLVAIEITV